MKKTSFLISFRSLTQLLVVLSVLISPMLIYAGTIYRCLDNDGGETLSDFPVDGQTCTQLGTFEEKTNVQKENKTKIFSDEKITNIIVKGNQVLVPVTLVYNREEVNVNLLLDTGAQGTTINTEIADRLYINLYKAKKAKAQVVGGSIIEASIVSIDVLKIGPHTIPNKNIAVIAHEGPAVNHDGLLGMDVLGGLGYKIDLAKQVIIWE
jgi:predicted aspartyl protease